MIEVDRNLQGPSNIALEAAHSNMATKLSQSSHPGITYWSVLVAFYTTSLIKMRRYRHCADGGCL